jgi:glycosyltransferase involved in cell wall biosynthesis
LRVAHVPFTFYPDPIGGTEIYVETLADGLKSCGIEPVIFAPSSNNENHSYDYNGLRVRRYRMAPTSDNMLRELYGEGDPTAAREFGQILDEECPDAVHLHAFTRGVSLLTVRAAKQRGIPVFFTYHTPTVSCQRGTLMMWGREICDGILNVRRCTACSLEGRGVPRPAAALVSAVPALVGRALETANLHGGVWTALRTPGLMQLRHETFRSLMREIDGVVALTEWVRAILLRNGVPGDKIILSRHGLRHVKGTIRPLIEVDKEPLRVAFLGRAHKDKGADTLIRALRTAPELPIELHLYGLTQSPADQEYWNALRREAANDNRIAFLPPIPNGEVVSLLKDYHLLAVPSRWLETGPLVVLESLAAGTPVIGSNLGGIAEWVRHEDNGLLVSPEDHQAWADAFRRCASDRGLVSKLRQRVEMPRSMADVAHEMALLYRRHGISDERSCSTRETSLYNRIPPAPNQLV